MGSQSYSSSSSTSTNLKQALSHSPLHSVRKIPTKPWKKPIAPLKSNPPRTYKVKPMDFKELVQKLTGGPDFQSHRLQSMAPSPLSISTTAVSDGHKTETALDLLPSPMTNTTNLSATYHELMSESLDTNPWKQLDSLGVLASPLGFSLSPSSHAWCSFLLKSPGTMSSLDQSTAL